MRKNILYRRLQKAAERTTDLNDTKDEGRWRLHEDLFKYNFTVLVPVKAINSNPVQSPPSSTQCETFEFFSIVFYNIYRICRICRILFLVIVKMKMAKYSIL